jgi:hypothetical protein
MSRKRPVAEFRGQGDYDVRRASDTETLTEAFERGDISPVQYTRLRANIVGRPNFVDAIVRPLADLFRDDPEPLTSDTE